MVNTRGSPLANLPTVAEIEEREEVLRSKEKEEGPAQSSRVTVTRHNRTVRHHSDPLEFVIMSLKCVTIFSSI